MASDPIDKKLDEDLEALFARLKRARIPIGIVERQRVHALVARLFVDRAVDDFAGLRPHLTPLLARHQQDVAEIKSIFESLSPAEGHEGEGGGEDDGGNGGSDDEASIDWRAWFRKNRYKTLAVVLGLLVAALITWLVPLPNTGVIETAELQEAISETAGDLVGHSTRDQPTDDPGDKKKAAARIMDAAIAYDFAPTLEELAGELVKTSKIGWTKGAFAQGLSELSGFARGRPLDVANLLDDDTPVDHLYLLSLALKRLEDPGPSIIVDPTSLLDAKKQGREAGSEVAIAVAKVIRQSGSFADLDRIEPVVSLENDRSSGKTGEKELGGEEAVAISPSFAARQFALVHPEFAHKLTHRPWVRDKPTPWSWLAMTGLLCLAPLLLAGIWWRNRKELRRAYLRRRLPKISPIYTDLIADQVSDHLRTTSSDRRVIQALQARSDTLTRRIDIDESIKATIRSGAREPTFVMRRLRPTPEYLVLIQRENAQDQTALRLQALLRRLASSVHFDIFFFQTAPDLLTPEAGGHAQPIEALAARFPDHRLLILGDGADFIDPRTGFLRPGADALITWEKRALLTPKPLRSWGRTEFQLARALAMPIGRATSEGLAVLGETLTSDQPSTAKLDPAGELVRSALPSGLQADQRRMIYPDPPSDYTPDQIVRDLQINLHPATFDWLAALAVYPTLQWDLTLYLGLSLTTRRGRQAGQCLFTEARAGMLTELPWLRHGYMPDWLRQALIEDMDEKRREEVGTLIRDLLEAAKKDGIANDSKINFRLAKEPGKDQLSPDRVFEDSVFVDFLDKAGIVDLPAPDKGFFKALSAVGWADRWSYVEFFVLAFAALYAVIFGLLAYLAEIPPMTGSWRPLALAGLGLLFLAGLGQGNPRTV
ncbi:MAG: hypothetical protein ACR2QF_02100 [Geminicoccaceae bacterium]